MTEMLETSVMFAGAKLGVFESKTSKAQPYLAAVLLEPNTENGIEASRPEWQERHTSKYRGFSLRPNLMFLAQQHRFQSRFWLWFRCGQTSKIACEVLG